jgi:hypothetical protein
MDARACVRCAIEGCSSLTTVLEGDSGGVGEESELVSCGLG